MYTYSYKKITNYIISSIFNIKDQPIELILILISGGQDSLLLIKLIENINKIKKISSKTEYLYIDHQWRNDSKKQTKHIINHIKSYSRSITVYEIKQLHYSENKMRKLRYQIINNHTIKSDKTIIITGHSLTDKIETFFNNLFRGTSIDGATSLIKSRHLNKTTKIIRPLIDLNRYDIQCFCRTFFLPIWSDSTNLNYYIKRNRLRHELIPYLKNYFFKNIEQNINSFLNIASLDNEYIKQNTIKLYLYTRHKSKIAINHSIIKYQHLAIQKRIIQLFFFHHFTENLNIKIIQKLIVAINKKNNNQQIIYNNKIICINKRWIYLK